MTFRTLAFFAFSAAAAVGQMQDNTEKKLDCREGRWGNDRGGRHCEMKEFTVAPTGRLDIDPGTNGGVSVRGWNQNSVLVRAQIQANADNDQEARQIVQQVQVSTAGSQVRVNGPGMERNRGWGVSFEIFVPHRTSLDVKAFNGGISLSDVAGDINFKTMNGGVALRRLGGRVKGETMNGGVDVVLAGSRWDGETLDVETTNGGVKMSVPENYSARLETSTVNGRISIDFPVTVSGDIKSKLSTTLGSGGPLIRATTTNGGVKISRASQGV
ncbi:MAG: hypothetical protein SFV54_04680 [Bryobacteraceae bacterium]|nr:hypothetical protein [Bryobacteraceae bacterium]